MKLTNKQITSIVVACSATAIAFFSWKIYKTTKDLKKYAVEAIEIENILAANAAVRHEERKKQPSTLEEVEDGLEGEYEPLEGLTDEEMYVDELEERGVEELRFPPNSEEALRQYKEMKLAEFDILSSGKRTLWKLFEVEFVPSNNADSIIMSNMIHDRREFFGPECIHNANITVADLLLYFGNMLDFDLDMGIEYWVNMLLFNLKLDPGTSSTQILKTVRELVNHAYVSERGFGMFGLDNAQYRNLVQNKLSTGLYTTNKMSFLSQYHQFLEGKMDEPEELEEEEEY